jgi:hypothetical protein
MQSPLLGFNNNVRHRGRLFHIQTEDSGVRHPHVITHLFMDGGRILKSIKRSYAEHVGSERLAEVVRDLMKEQHKAMFIALRDGHFDRVLEGEEASKSGERPAQGRMPSSSGLPVDSADGPTSTMGPRRDLPHATSSADPPVTTPPREPSRPSESGGSIGRASSRREAPDLFQRSPAESVSVVTHDAARSSSVPVEAKSRDRQSSGRYAASRPAAIFSSGRPPEAGGSLFGDDLINEKSLDEVILSYLSEDLEEKPDKK